MRQKFSLRFKSIARAFQKTIAIFSVGMITAVFWNINIPLAMGQFSCLDTTHGSSVPDPHGGTIPCNEVCASVGQACVQATECPLGGCMYFPCDVSCASYSTGCQCDPALPPCTVTNASWLVNSTCTGPNGVFTDSCADPMTMNKYLCGGTGNCDLNVKTCFEGSCAAGACNNHCVDLAQDYDETGIDCGGIACAPCAGPICVPGPCDGVCNVGCSVAQDPDCGCQNGDGCCGIIGCTNVTDSECPAVCVPAVCGNGVIDSNEVCDFSAMSIGCPALQTCSVSCTACENHLCGDGIIDIGETCDFSAMPTGCGALVCNGNCTACISGSCAPNSCNPLNPNQYCISGLWVNCPGNKICSGAGVCGASTIPLCDLNSWYYCSPLSIIKTFSQAAEAFLRYILGIIGIVALLFIVIAGIMYITSAGSEERITASKRILTGSVIGLGTALFAYSLLRIIMSILNGI